MAQTGAFQIIGHRGVPCDAPENSLAGFQRAMELGLTHVECDLQLSRDGHVVLMHDRTVDRTTDGSGRLSYLTLDEIRGLDCGSWFHPRYAGERVPTLEELLDVVGGECHAVLEIKEADRYVEATSRIAEVVEARGLVEQVSITSFYWEALEEARRISPGIEVQALIHSLDGTVAVEGSPLPICYAGIDELLADPRVNFVDVLCPRADDVNDRTVSLLKGLGFSVRAWGARTDCRGEIMRLLRCGIDGMTVDHPEIVRAVCRQWRGPGS